MTDGPGRSDCHVHVIGDPADWPLSPERGYAPAPFEGRMEHMQRHSIDRAVVVRTSV